MTNKFAQALKNEDSRQSVSVTENGALGFARTKSSLVDFFFKVGSMRNMPETQIESAFAEAYAEDPLHALELMHFIRDCRGGMGEKRVFKICFDWLVQNFPGDACNLVNLIPEYGSWKTFFELTDTFRKNKNVENVAKQIFLCQWDLDFNAFLNGKHSVSLLGKWAPSENASSKESKRLACYWRNVLKMDAKHYRKALSAFRNKIRIVEKDISANNWSEIDYNAVPAKAGMLYKNAFLKHDEARRRLWLADLAAGKNNAKINTSGLTAPEIIHRYLQYSGWSASVPDKEDPVLEAAWKDLVSKNMLPENAISMLPVMDGSGSMYTNISLESSLQAIEVCIGLGLFLANINTSAWRGMCIEFGARPVFFQVPTGASLREQIKIVLQHNDCGNTDVQAVFNLILNTARKNGFTQKEIPQIVTFSDMEFDAAYQTYDKKKTERLFETIAQDYASEGYFLPKMVFWNICSRTGTIPVTENEMGVSLLSGFSQSIMDMLLSRKLDPLEILLEKLNAPRYNLVREALK